MSAQKKNNPRTSLQTLLIFEFPISVISEQAARCTRKALPEGEVVDRAWASVAFSKTALLKMHVWHSNPEPPHPFLGLWASNSQDLWWSQESFWWLIRYMKASRNVWRMSSGIRKTDTSVKANQTLGMAVGKCGHKCRPSSSHASVSPFLWKGVSPYCYFCDFTHADKMLMVVREALIKGSLCIWAVAISPSAALPWYFFIASHISRSSPAFPWRTAIFCFFPGGPCRRRAMI